MALACPFCVQGCKLSVNLPISFNSAEGWRSIFCFLALGMLAPAPATMGLTRIRLLGGIGLAVIVFVGPPVTKHGIHDVQSPPRKRGHRRVAGATLRPLSVVVIPRLVAEQD